MLPGFGGFAAAVLTFVLILAAGVVLAELARRHHRTVARQGRHGKRGSDRGREARSAGTAGPRLPVAGGEDRSPAGRDREHRPLMFRRLRGEPERPPPRQRAPAGRKPPYPTAAAPDPSPARQQPEVPAQCQHHPAASRPEHRAQRAAARSGGSVPSEWGPVIAQTADFEPEDDGELLEWMSRQVTGLSAWAEALVDFYDHATNTIGIDPKASAMLHDVADAAAQAAETMGAAKAKFTEHYELPREFAGNGGLMTHDGRWITGEGA